MEIIKLHRGDCSSHPGRDGFTGVTHKVRDREQRCGVGGVGWTLYVKVPEDPGEEGHDEGQCIINPWNLSFLSIKCEQFDISNQHELAGGGGFVRSE